MERLVNAGRARNAYAILGLQSRAQLESTYGEATADAILSGLSQEVFLRVGDQPSVEYVRDRLGRVQNERQVQGPTDLVTRGITGRRVKFTQTTLEENYQIGEDEVQQFQPGEAIVVTQEDWSRGRLYQLEEVRQVLDEWHLDRSTPSTDSPLETSYKTNGTGEDSQEDAARQEDQRVDTQASSSDEEAKPETEQAQATTGPETEGGTATTDNGDEQSTMEEPAEDAVDGSESTGKDD